MRSFRVVWEIDIEADTPRDAAEQALAIQRNPESIETVFEVFNGRESQRVDLLGDRSEN